MNKRIMTEELRKHERDCRALLRRARNDGVNGRFGTHDEGRELSDEMAGLHDETTGLHDER